MYFIDQNVRNTIYLCQKYLADNLTFQTVDDLDYVLNVLNGNNVSEENMDRLKELKFNPFDSNNIIALSGNKANMDNPIKIKCEYYLSNDFNPQKSLLEHRNSFH